MYDPSGTGAVDYASFERMHTFIVQTQENFKVIDRNGDGKLSRAEVETALEQAGAILHICAKLQRAQAVGSWSLKQARQLQSFVSSGFSLSQPAFASLFAAYDPPCLGHLDLPGFLGLTIFLQSASGMFEGYAKGTSSINLTFDQFVYAASHCR